MFKNIILVLIIIVIKCESIDAQSASIKEEANIYEPVSDVPLTLKGEKLSYFHDLYSQKPILLAFVFTRCSGVCYPFLLQLKEDIQLIDNTSINVLVLSFDPRDRLKDMEEMSQRMGLWNNSQWLFGVTDSIEKLKYSISFFPQWDSVINQFNHDALLVGINQDGYITKKLLGIRGRHDLELMIASMNNVFSPTYRLPSKNTMFSCFDYDPTTGKSKPGLGLFFVALPTILGVFIVVSIQFIVRGKISLPRKFQKNT